MILLASNGATKIDGGGLKFKMMNGDQMKLI